MSVPIVGPGVASLKMIGFLRTAEKALNRAAEYAAQTFRNRQAIETHAVELRSLIEKLEAKRK